MAKVYELNYVAWDIAVEENRISLVEANAAGMINTIQVAGGSPKKALIHKLAKELEHKSKGSTQDSYQMILCHGAGFD